MRYCAVVPHEVISYYGSSFRSNPIGTGPFYFKRWDENVKLVLRKNTRYFEKDVKGRKLPYLEAVSIQFIPDIQSEFMLFLQGKLDFIISFLPSFHPSPVSLSSFPSLPSFPPVLPSILPSTFPSFLPSFLPSILPSFPC